jgi:hypothetical protein
MSDHKSRRNGNIEWGGMGEALKMHKNASSSYGLWSRLSENCVLIPVVAIFKNNLCGCTYVLVLLDNTSKFILVFLHIER